MLNEINLAKADLNLLLLFDAVLTERHVGRAAKRLNLTPSAVSHGLTRLRQLLNDPLFLKAPSGVVPTARALELAAPVAEVLARVRQVLVTAAPFDPKTSARRFVIGLPDATAIVLLPPLLAQIRLIAPRVDIGVRYLHRDTALAELDARGVDIAVVPVDDVPARFVTTALFADDFVIAARAGHAFAATPTLECYCDQSHLIVALDAVPHAYIDDVLAGRGLSRRVALTVPNFMLALAVIGETDLIGALPSGLVAMHGPRFGVTGTKAPLPLRSFQLRAVAPQVAMADAGVAWLFDLLRRD